MSTKERPILFSGAMVRAILEGRKTQTRRVVKPLPSWKPHSVCDPPGASDDWAVWFHFPETKRVGHIRYCPYGKTGDRLWVREAFEQVHPCQIEDDRFSIDGQAGIPGPPPVTFQVIYGADGPYPRRHFIQEYPYRAVCIGEACSRSHLHPEESWQGWTPSIHMPRWASRLSLEIVNVKVERVQDISESEAIAEGCEKPTGIEISHTFMREVFHGTWDYINSKPGFGWDENPWVWVIEFKRLEVAN